MSAAQAVNVVAFVVAFAVAVAVEFNPVMAAVFGAAAAATAHQAARRRPRPGVLTMATMTTFVHGADPVTRCLCGQIAARWPDGTPVTTPATCADCDRSGRYFTTPT